MLLQLQRKTRGLPASPAWYFLCLPYWVICCATVSPFGKPPVLKPTNPPVAKVMAEDKAKQQIFFGVYQSLLIRWRTALQVLHTYSMGHFIAQAGTLGAKFMIPSAPCLDWVPGSFPVNSSPVLFLGSVTAGSLGSWAAHFETCWGGGGKWFSPWKCIDWHVSILAQYVLLGRMEGWVVWEQASRYTAGNP